MCCSGGVDTHGGTHDSWSHHARSGREDVNGALEHKFQKASCGGQLGMDCIAVAKTFRTNYQEARTIFNLQAADCPVGLGLKGIGQSHNRSKTDKRLPQGQFVNT